jgi:hypothetical protein
VEVIPFNYAITAYGADYAVDGLVKRVKSGDIFIPLFSLPSKTSKGEPRFQREFVCKKQQATALSNHCCSAFLSLGSA